MAVEVYGSAAAGLALDTSDIDIGICGIKAGDKQEMLQCMEAVVNALTGKTIITRAQIIQTASVPVIKTEVNLGVLSEEWKGAAKLDIAFDDFAESEHPIKYGVLFADWVTLKREQQPHLCPLVVIVKKLLSLRGLNVPFHGTRRTNSRRTEFVRADSTSRRVPGNLPRLSHTRAQSRRVPQILRPRIQQHNDVCGSRRDGSEIPR